MTTERERRLQLLPDNMKLRDRVAYRTVHMLGAAQEFILTEFVREPCWRSQDGTVKLLRDLKSDHLLNIERMLQRTDRSDSLKYQQVVKELWRRGCR